MSEINLSGMNSIIFNNTSLDKVIFDGTEVWSAGYDLLNLATGTTLYSTTGAGPGYGLSYQTLGHLKVASGSGYYAEGGNSFTDIAWTGYLSSTVGLSYLYEFDVSKYNTLYLKGSTVYDGTISQANGGDKAVEILLVRRRTTTTGATYYLEVLDRIYIPYNYGNTDTGEAGTSTFDFMVDVSKYDVVSIGVSVSFEEYDSDMSDDDWANYFELKIDEFKFGNRQLASTDWYLVKDGTDVSGLGITSNYSMGEYGYCTKQSGIFNYDVQDESYEDDEGEWYYDFSGRFYFHNNYDNKGNKVNTSNAFQIYNIGLQYTTLNVKYTFTSSKASSEDWAYWSAAMQLSQNNSHTKSALDACRDISVDRNNYEPHTISIDISNVEYMWALYLYLYFESNGYQSNITITDIWLS